MILCERLFLFEIQRNYTRTPSRPCSGTGKRGPQDRDAGGIFQVLGFRCRVAIDDGFFVLCDPAGDALP